MNFRSLSKKHRVIAAMGGLVIVLILVALYRASKPEPVLAPVVTNSPEEAPSAQPLPESLDGITQEILREGEGDVAALENEEASAQSQVQAEAGSLHTLENSYDESSF